MSAKKAAVEALGTSGILAFSVAQLSAAIGLSERQLYKHIERGDMVPKYSGRKRIIPADEARRFLADLPEEEWEL